MGWIFGSVLIGQRLMLGFLCNCNNKILSLQNGTSLSISQSEMSQSGSDLGQSYGSEGQLSPRPVPPRLMGDIYTFKKQEESVETADVKVDRIFQIIVPSLIAGKVTKIASFYKRQSIIFLNM